MIFPVASSVVIPEIVLALPAENCLAPTTLLVTKLDALQPILSDRWTANLKSDAFSGVPSEYLRPLRIVIV